MRNEANVIQLADHRRRMSGRTDASAARSALHAHVTKRGDVEFKVDRLAYSGDARSLLLAVLVMGLKLARDIDGGEVSYD